jgi:fructose-bisphosphate aldolase class II
MRTPSKELLKNGYGKYAVGAFNVFNAEQIHGVMRGAQNSGLPVLLQLTPVARNYMHDKVLRSVIKAAGEIYQETQYGIHLDHGNYEHCVDAIQSGGYDSVMIDASHEDFEKNIEITSEVVKRAHDKGISVEAELGVLSGLEDDLSIDSEMARYTRPDQVSEFIGRTHCDSLAIAIGTSHGAYKFSGNQTLRIDILEKIHEIAPGFPFVLHGASAVPSTEIKRINSAGGQLENDAQGTKLYELQAAIRLGVCKVNIATDLRLIWTRIHREFFRDSPELFDPVIPGKQYMNELEKFVSQKCLSLLAINIKNEIQ